VCCLSRVRVAEEAEKAESEEVTWSQLHAFQWLTDLRNTKIHTFSRHNDTLFLPGSMSCILPTAA
jgi:hypothetical protein